MASEDELNQMVLFLSLSVLSNGTKVEKIEKINHSQPLMKDSLVHMGTWEMYQIDSSITFSLIWGIESHIFSLNNLDCPNIIMLLNKLSDDNTPP